MKTSLKVMFCTVATIGVLVFASLLTVASDNSQLVLLRTSIFVISVILIIIIKKKDANNELKLLKQILLLIPLMFALMILKVITYSSGIGISNDLLVGAFVIGVIVIFGGPIIIAKMGDREKKF